MIFPMFHCVHHSFFIRCHFDEILSESCSACLCENFDTKVELFTFRITEIELSETIGCGPLGAGGTSGRIGV